VRIDVVGTGCPVLPGVTVGVQRGTEVVDVRGADGGDLRWTLEARRTGAHDLRGPYVHGRPGARFLYLSWAREPEGMFRRAKLMLDEVPAALLDGAEEQALLATLPLAMADGSPVCAAVRPPQIAWTLLTQDSTIARVSSTTVTNVR
jgi:hypothetical protein